MTLGNATWNGTLQLGEQWTAETLKSGASFTFWLGWDDYSPRFLDGGEQSFLAAKAANQDNRINEYFSVLGLEQSLAANSNFLNAYDGAFTYAWFKDNGTVGQLPPPGGYALADKIVEFTFVPNYLKKELLGTNLWKRL